MTEWERLTPQDNDPDRDILYYYRPDCHGEHSIAAGPPGSVEPGFQPDAVYPNDAELLALARKCEKVKALVEAVRDEANELEREGGIILYRTRAALAPFDD